MKRRYVSRSRPPRLTDTELAALRELCQTIPKFMPSVTLYGHRVTVLHLQAGPTPPHYQFPSHIQSVYEGHLVLAGNCVYTISTPRQLETGSMVLHGPDVEHCWETRDERLDWAIFWLRIDPDVAVPEPSRWPVVLPAIWEVALMVDDFRAGNSGWQERTIARMTTILSYLLGVTMLLKFRIVRRRQTNCCSTQLKCIYTNIWRIPYRRRTSQRLPVSVPEACIGSTVGRFTRES